MSVNTEGGFFQGCAKKGGFNPGGVLSWGGSFLPPRQTDFVLALASNFILYLPNRNMYNEEQNRYR